MPIFLFILISNLSKISPKYINTLYIINNFNPTLYTSQSTPDKTSPKFTLSPNEVFINFRKTRSMILWVARLVCETGMCHIDEVTQTWTGHDR